jgi:glyoxylase-like metal-dependent hydrolase (beta-lactamase superfamily II)
VFARVDYEADHELEAQIAKTGHDIKDVKAVIMGHLHLDHAGGLEHFVGTDVRFTLTLFFNKYSSHGWK